MSEQAIASVPEWFLQARLGQFIHWGLYAILGRGEQSLYREHLHPGEYRKLADQFNPVKFNADEWAAFARETGHRYALFTSKHHDGYCMFHTQSHQYNSFCTRPGRDFVDEYVRAYRNAGLKVGIYFSTADWNHPGYFAGPQTSSSDFRAFIKMTRMQIRELCSQYGKIDIFWFDGSWPYHAEDWQAQEIYDEIRRLQPGIILNDRLCLPGDITTPEQNIPEEQMSPKKPWESCMTSTEKFWGYHAGVKWKKPAQTIRELAKVADVGGNLLYNVGPKPDGSFPQPYKHLLRKVGDWLAINGESIYGTTRTICDTTTFGLMTCRRNRIYLHLLHHPGPELHVAGIRNRVKQAHFLAGGATLPFVQDKEGHLRIEQIPAELPDKADTVIALDISGVPRSFDWATERIWAGWLADDNLQFAQQVIAKRRAWAMDK